MVRQINWSGYTWNVVNDSWSGNNFSDSTDNVFVDSQGNLHLKITYRNGTWYSAEVVSANPVGYGTYTTVVASDISVLDKNVDAGSFYYNNANKDEIDIEFSRWGTNYLPPNVEYTVWQTGANATESTHISLSSTTNTTNIINYQPNGISCQTKDSNGNIIASWTYPGTYIPKTGGNYEFEMFLYPNGNPPSNGLEQEIIFSSFSYDPSVPIIGSIKISPTSANINMGNTQQLAATCIDQNNNMMTCPMLTWSSSNASMAAVSSSGIVKGIAKGIANITASSGNITSNMSTITVTEMHILATIQISLPLKIGTTKQLTTVCIDQNNNMMTCPKLIWSSSNTNMATVSSSGAVKGIARGTVNITASSGTIISNTFIITVIT